MMLRLSSSDEKDTACGFEGEGEHREKNMWNHLRTEWLKNCLTTLCPSSYNGDSSLIVVVSFID